MRICYKCGHLGHISKFCEKDRICLGCGNGHLKEDEDSRSCTLPKSCINCTGDHAATDFSCPALQKRKLINKIMAIENLPFLEAKRRATQSNTNLHHGQRSFDFPLLPTTGSSQGPSYADAAKTNIAGDGFRKDNATSALTASVKSMDSSMVSFLCEIVNWFRSNRDQEKLRDRIRNTVKLHFDIFSIPQSSQPPIKPVYTLINKEIP